MTTVLRPGQVSQRRRMGWLLPLMVLLVLVLVLVMRSSVPEQAPAPPYWPTQGWRTTPPEEHGFDSAKMAAGLQAIRDQNLDVHSLLIIRNGDVLLDATFYPYDGTTVHEVASVTKSIMTTLIGIAVDQGKLQLDQPMLSFFPDRTVANRDARKERITVRHLVTMSSGLDCTAEGDERTLQEMRTSPDWAQFTLDRPVLWEPGSHFVYCSPAIHLLSPILQRATGMTALDFARQNLFAPLGIQNVIWATDPQGYNRGSEGIYLQPRDMAKIGYLWLNQGQWEGTQIVSRAWVEQSVKSHLKTDGNDDYGYAWWVMTGDGAGQYAAVGRGGQRIHVLPSANVIVVMTGGGADWDQTIAHLAPAAVAMGQRLPANSEGAARLNVTLAAIAQPPAPKPVAPLPDTARRISGKTIVFAPNRFGISAVRLDFDASAPATMYITTLDGGQPALLRVGLDGVYRMAPGPYDLPMGGRGAWEDSQTFVWEYDNIANNDHVLFRTHFDGNRVTLEGRETAHELGVQAEGQVQD
ncbi:MAG: serine hydrolase [Anaerolineae bacterium]|nr:serine hydrolase [Anaerolineae bacterium]